MIDRSRSTDAGFSLIEVLVTVVIMGLTFVVFVGGMGTSIIASDHHRKHAVAQASIRNFAEAVKAVPFSTDCANVIATYRAAYSPPPPTRLSSTGLNANSLTHVTPGVKPTTRNTRLLAFNALANMASITPPSGMSAKWVVSSQSATFANRVTVGFHEQAVTASGPTGSRTATSTASANSVSQLVSVESATPNAGPPTYRPVSIKWTPPGGAAELSIAAPSTTEIGDAMFAQVAVRSVDATVSPPPGWTLVSAATNGTSVKSLIYERTATVPGTPAGAPFTWAFSATTEAAGGIVAYGGATKNYTATVTGVSYLDSTGTATDCSTPANIAAQIVSLRFETLDQRGIETIDVVKRCREKKTPSTLCEDS